MDQNIVCKQNLLSLWLTKHCLGFYVNYAVLSSLSLLLASSCYFKQTVWTLSLSGNVWSSKESHFSLLILSTHLPSNIQWTFRWSKSTVNLFIFQLKKKRKGKTFAWTKNARFELTTKEITFNRRTLTTNKNKERKGKRKLAHFAWQTKCTIWANNRKGKLLYFAVTKKMHDLN